MHPVAAMQRRSVRYCGSWGIWLHSRRRYNARQGQSGSCEIFVSGGCYAVGPCSRPVSDSSVDRQQQRFDHLLAERIEIDVRRKCKASKTLGGMVEDQRGSFGGF